MNRYGYVSIFFLDKYGFLTILLVIMLKRLCILIFLIDKFNTNLYNRAQFSFILFSLPLILGLGMLKGEYVWKTRVSGILLN